MEVNEIEKGRGPSSPFDDRHRMVTIYERHCLKKGLCVVNIRQQWRRTVVITPNHR